MFCFSKTCRICKCSANSFTLTCNLQKEVCNLFFSMFPELMNSKLNRFLKNLCVPCVKQLLSFEDFKTQCRKSDECYMRYLNQLKGHDGIHAELVCELGIKQEHCKNDDNQIQPTFNISSIQEVSNYYGLEATCSSTDENIQIDIVKREISMSVIEEETEGAIVEAATSIFGCEEIRDTLTFANQEMFASDYHRSIDTEIIDGNENEIDIMQETVELSSKGGIEEFNFKFIDSSVDTRAEKGNIEPEFWQRKDDLSRMAENDNNEIDIVKHEVSIVDIIESCNPIGSSANKYESLNITGKKLSLNHHKRNHTWIVERIKTHTDKEPYQSIAGLSNLIVHKTTHTSEKPFKCDICNKSFSKRSYLKTHIRIHTSEKPYQCDLCKKSFSRKQYLVVHKRNHIGEKPYKCDLCKKSFLQKSHLILHKRIHTGETPYECDTCKKSFTQLPHLKSHKRTHTGEKPYECDICKKRFSQTSSLILHKRIHTGEKPYECDICKQRFSESFHQKLHKRTHTGEKLYECDICKQRFSRLNHLKLHKRTHTGEKPYE